MPEPTPRQYPAMKAAIEGGCIVLLTLYVALMFTGDMRRMHSHTWLAGGIVGMGIVYMYGRHHYYD